MGVGSRSNAKSAKWILNTLKAKFTALQPSTVLSTSDSYFFSFIHQAIDLVGFLRTPSSMTKFAVFRLAGQTGDGTTDLRDMA